jgi:hypothetical protein
MMLEILKASGGAARSFSDQEILTSLQDWAEHEGVLHPQKVRPQPSRTITC